MIALVVLALWVALRGRPVLATLVVAAAAAAKVPAVVALLAVVVLSDPPSVVREVVPISRNAKHVGSDEYLEVRGRLGKLLHAGAEEGEGDGNVDAFFE